MRLRPVFALAALLLSAPLHAADWPSLSKQSSVPLFPPEWRGKEPTREMMDQWRGPEAARLVKLAAELEGFAVEHPEAPELNAVREKESEALYAASRLGHAGADGALALLDRLRLSDPKLEAETRLGIRSRQVEQEARVHGRESIEAGQKAFIQGARALTKEFPQRPEPWIMVIEMATGEDAALNRALLDEVRDGSGPPEVRKYAEAVRRRLESLGKPLELKLFGMEGQTIDLSALKGQVVLLNFWGTFSGPSVEQQAELRDLYEKLHEQKLEIVGINLDEQPRQTMRFVLEEHLTWPQVCDGRGWKGEVAERYGVRSIPALWLIDRHGLVRDLHGGTNLKEKVQLLIDEKE